MTTSHHAGTDVEALAARLRPDGDFAVLCGALESLAAQAEATAAREPLLALAGHPSFSVRWRVAAALRAAHGGDRRVEDALVALAGDPRPIVRLEAVDALALLPTPRTAAVDDALRTACGDDDERTVVSALVGLARARAALPAGPLARVLAPARMVLVAGRGRGAAARRAGALRAPRGARAAARAGAAVDAARPGRRPGALRGGRRLRAGAGRPVGPDGRPGRPTSGP